MRDLVVARMDAVDDTNASTQLNYVAQLLATGRSFLITPLDDDDDDDSDEEE